MDGKFLNLFTPKVRSFINTGHSEARRLVPCPSPMLNYDPKKDIINPKRCQIWVQRLEEKKSDVIFPNRGVEIMESPGRTLTDLGLTV